MKKILYIIELIPAIPVCLFALRVIQCIVYLPVSLLGSLIGIVFAPVICLFMNPVGLLPRWLKWFEPVDTANGCLDTAWVKEHPNWGLYRCAWTFISRNPFYGAEATLLSVKPTVTKRLGGNPDEGRGVTGWFLILSDNGVFQFKAIWNIGSVAIIHEVGWQIKDPQLVTGGSYLLAPIRFYNFNSKGL